MWPKLDWRGWLVAGALYTILVGFVGCRVEANRWEGRLETAERDLALRGLELMRLRADSATLAERFRVDTITLTKRITEWKRYSVLVTDTLHKTDTITVERVVQVAQGAINACTTALTTCEQRADNAEQRAAKLAQQNADLARLLARPKPLVTPERVALLGALGWIAWKVVH